MSKKRRGLGFLVDPMTQHIQNLKSQKKLYHKAVIRSLTSLPHKDPCATEKQNGDQVHKSL